LGALRDALVKTHSTQLHPFRSVVIPFASYAGVWEAERRALAHSMPPDELDVIEQAFAALSTLQKNEALGGDLREEVFDGLYDAGQQCEFARRIAWKHAQTPRSRVERWIKLRGCRLQERRDHRKLGRAIVKARKQASCPAFSWWPSLCTTQWELLDQEQRQASTRPTTTGACVKDSKIPSFGSSSTEHAAKFVKSIPASVNSKTAS